VRSKRRGVERSKEERRGVRGEGGEERQNL